MKRSCPSSGSCANRISADLTKEDVLIKVQQLILGNTSPSDDLYPSQSAVKTYVDANSSISAITSKTTDYNVLSSDYTILCNAARVLLVSRC
jgi:hypothetical protein